MDQSGVLTALEEVSNAVARVSAATSSDKSFEEVHALVLAVFELGLALQSSAKPVPRKLQVRLNADGKALAEQLPKLTYYLFRFEQRFTGPWESSWLSACKVRSGLQFLFYSIYAGTKLETSFNTLGPDELQDLDDLMRHRAVHDGGVASQNIPAGVPVSHWWWWAPDPPPR